MRGNPSSVVGGPNVWPPAGSIRFIQSVMPILPGSARSDPLVPSVAEAPIVEERAGEAVAAAGEVPAADKAFGQA